VVDATMVGPDWLRMRLTAWCTTSTAAPPPTAHRPVPPSPRRPTGYAAQCRPTGTRCCPATHI
jgi:hypothetical protein